jgi:hypothetical protein
MKSSDLRRQMITVMFFLLFPYFLLSQEYETVPGDDLLHFRNARQERFSMPFRLLNNLIIIPASINGSDTLFFILDTGLDMSIISELSSGKTVDLKNAREIQLDGFSPDSAADAILTVGNTLEIGDLKGTNQEFIVLTKNILRLSTRLGTRIHGLLSLRAFQSFVVEINYENRIISFYNPDTYKLSNPKGSYSSMPCQLIQGMPYIRARITPYGGDSFSIPLLLDSGSSCAFILDPQALPGFKIPPESPVCVVGLGIQGDISGVINRMKTVEIGSYDLEDALVFFPESQGGINSEDSPEINASLGSEVLSRFNLVLNLPKNEIYLSPNNCYGREFNYNMSGIDVITPVPDARTYVVSRVRMNSAAELAGLKTGDELLSINGEDVSAFDLDGIYSSLLGREGKKITLRFLRDTEIIKVSFRLEKYI